MSYLIAAANRKRKKPYNMDDVKFELVTDKSGKKKWKAHLPAATFVLG